MGVFDERIYGRMKVNYTFMTGTKIMKMKKVCYEFCWEGGDGYFGAGFGTSQSIYVRYRHVEEGGIGRNGVNIVVSGDAFLGAKYEPVMVCLDRSDLSNLQFIIKKGSLTRIGKFSSSSINENTKWKLILWNYEKSDGVDFVELHLRKSQIKNQIPDGFSPWLIERTCVKMSSCNRNNLFLLVTQFIIFS